MSSRPSLDSELSDKDSLYSAKGFSKLSNALLASPVASTDDLGWDLVQVSRSYAGTWRLSSSSFSSEFELGLLSSEISNRLTYGLSSTMGPIGFSSEYSLR